LKGYERSVILLRKMTDEMVSHYADASEGPFRAVSRRQQSPTGYCPANAVSLGERRAASGTMSALRQKRTVIYALSRL